MTLHSYTRALIRATLLVRGRLLNGPARVAPRGQPAKLKFWLRAHLREPTLGTLVTRIGVTATEATSDDRGCRKVAPHGRSDAACNPRGCFLEALPTWRSRPPSTHAAALHEKTMDYLQSGTVVVWVS